MCKPARNDEIARFPRYSELLGQSRPVDQVGPLPCSGKSSMISATGRCTLATPSNLLAGSDRADSAHVPYANAPCAPQLRQDDRVGASLISYETAAGFEPTVVWVLEPDPRLGMYGRTTPLPQAWVDLFNLPGWQAARFVHALLPHVVTDDAAA